MAPEAALGDMAARRRTEEDPARKDVTGKLIAVSDLGASTWLNYRKASMVPGPVAPLHGHAAPRASRAAVELKTIKSGATLQERDRSEKERVTHHSLSCLLACLSLRAPRNDLKDLLCQSVEH